MPNLELPVLTDEYIRVAIESIFAGAAIDPTSFAVELAFMQGNARPAAGDWKTAAWETDATTIPDPTYYAYAKPSPQLTAGTWQPWSRVHAGSELVVRKLVNKVIITP